MRAFLVGAAIIATVIVPFVLAAVLFGFVGLIAAELIALLVVVGVLAWVIGSLVMDWHS